MSSQALSIEGALRLAKAAGVDRLDAQLLLAHILERPRSWLLAHGDALLDAVQADALRAVIARRADGEPLAYLVGTKEFHGLLLQVDARVLVPRPDTEVLVDWAIELLAAGALSRIAEPRVVDLGTGSGAIALAVKHGYGAAAVTATDVSAGALAVAQANAQRHGLELEWRSGVWWEAVGDDPPFHLALGNPPYIAARDPHLAALCHEPELALTPGGDALDALRTIVAAAPDHLEQGGWLLLEHGFDQAAAVQALLRDQGFEAIETRRDAGGQLRCTGARR